MVNGDDGERKYPQVYSQPRQPRPANDGSADTNDGTDGQGSDGRRRDGDRRRSGPVPPPRPREHHGDQASEPDPNDDGRRPRTRPRPPPRPRDRRSTTDDRAADPDEPDDDRWRSRRNGPVPPPRPGDRAATTGEGHDNPRWPIRGIVENREELQNPPLNLGRAALGIAAAILAVIVLLEAFIALAMMLIVLGALMWLVFGRMLRLPLGMLALGRRRPQSPRKIPRYRYRLRAAGSDQLVECVIASHDGASVDRGDEVEVWGRQEVRTRRITATRIHNLTTGTVLRRSHIGARS